MRIINVKPVKSEQVVKTIDCFVGNGYLQGAGGSLPDVDTDFQRRP